MLIVISSWMEHLLVQKTDTESRKSECNC